MFLNELHRHRLIKAATSCIPNQYRKRALLANYTEASPEPRLIAAAASGVVITLPSASGNHPC